MDVKDSIADVATCPLQDLEGADGENPTYLQKGWEGDACILDSEEQEKRETSRLPQTLSLGSILMPGVTPLARLVWQNFLSN